MRRQVTITRLDICHYRIKGPRTTLILGEVEERDYRIWIAGDDRPLVRFTNPDDTTAFNSALAEGVRLALGD